LGYTLHLPEEEKFLMSKDDILTEIRTLLAGRCAEELVFNTQTSGAANDIERATELARNLVARFGMSDKFGMMALGTVQSQYLDGGYSMNCAQETFAAADKEVVDILQRCHDEAVEILKENRAMLDEIAAYLIKRETITGAQMMAILAGRDPDQEEYYGVAAQQQKDSGIEAPAKHINIVSEPVLPPQSDEPQETGNDAQEGEKKEEKE
jgi:cell division protease FtsH